MSKQKKFNDQVKDLVAAHEAREPKEAAVITHYICDFTWFATGEGFRIHICNVFAENKEDCIKSAYKAYLSANNDCGFGFEFFETCVSVLGLSTVNEDYKFIEKHEDFNDAIEVLKTKVNLFVGKNYEEKFYKHGVIDGDLNFFYQYNLS